METITYVRFQFKRFINSSSFPEENEICCAITINCFRKKDCGLHILNDGCGFFWKMCPRMPSKLGSFYANKGGTPWGCAGRFGACGVSAGVFGEGDLSGGYVCSSSVLKNNQSSSLAGLQGTSVHLPLWEPELYELSKTEVLLQTFAVEMWQQCTYLTFDTLYV